MRIKRKISGLSFILGGAFVVGGLLIWRSPSWLWPGGILGASVGAFIEGLRGDPPAKR